MRHGLLVLLFVFLLPAAALAQEAVYRVGVYQNPPLLYARDGTRYRITDSASPIRNTQGETIGTVIMLHDVAAQFKNEDNEVYLDSPPGIATDPRE